MSFPSSMDLPVQINPPALGALMWVPALLPAEAETRQFCPPLLLVPLCSAPQPSSAAWSSVSLPLGRAALPCRVRCGSAVLHCSCFSSSTVLSICHPPEPRWCLHRAFITHQHQKLPFASECTQPPAVPLEPPLSFCAFMIHWSISHTPRGGCFLHLDNWWIFFSPWTKAPWTQVIFGRFHVLMLNPGKTSEWTPLNLIRIFALQPLVNDGFDRFRNLLKVEAKITPQICLCHLGHNPKICPLAGELGVHS